ncbi:MAG: hydrogenase maturation protease [Gaiellaceae bacterium]|jgi:hydrogenase maturation protease
MNQILVVGTGNSWRGDDAVGLEVASALRGRLPDTVRVLATEAEQSSLLDEWEGCDAVIIVDAAHSGAPAGTIYRVDLNTEVVPHAVLQGSTHHFSLGDTIELARALRRLPVNALFFGIEGESFAPGEPLSPAVAAAVPAIVEEIATEVGAFL